MHITCVGGARTVTGSCFWCRNEHASLLVDCGMFHGPQRLEERNRAAFPFSPKEIQAVLLTHAHIDHSGLLPRLVREGFRGKIYATPATADLSTIMLPDSAHIQETEAQWQARKNLRRGALVPEPLYTQADVERTLARFEAVPYGATFTPSEGIDVCFHDAGHILGSAIIECTFTAEGRSRKLVFSGDIGNRDQPIVRDPEPVQRADYVVIESTYGNRLHRSMKDTIDEFASILLEAYRDGGKIIIPAFAVERTQEVLYALHVLESQKRIPVLPTFVDSPLAISATEIFRRHPECFDEQTRHMILQGTSPLTVQSLTFTRTTEESRNLNELKGPAIIISASGMCDAGRILHHLKHTIWRPETHVVIIGFQAQGTLGRKLVEGAQRIRLFHEDVVVRAKIHTLGGFSAHADQAGLTEWLSGIQNPQLKVYVVHGEEEISLAFAKHLKHVLPCTPYVPMLGETLHVLEEPAYREDLWPSREQVAPPQRVARLIETLQSLIEKLSSGPWDQDQVDRQRLERQLGKLTKVVEKIEGLLDKQQMQQFSAYKRRRRKTSG